MSGPGPNGVAHAGGGPGPAEAAPPAGGGAFRGGSADLPPPKRRHVEEEASGAGEASERAVESRREEGRIVAQYLPPGDLPAQPVLRKSAQNSVVRCIACSSTAVYTGSADEQVKEWTIKDNQLLNPRALDDHDYGVTGMDVSRDENVLAVGSLDGRIRCWDLRSQKCVRDIKGGSGANQSGPGDVSQVKFSFDGLRVISAGALGRLRIWDLRKGVQCETTLDLFAAGGGVQSGAVQCLSVSPKGTYVTFGTERGSVGLANLEKGQLCGLVPVHKRPVRSVGFSRDTRKVIAGCDDGYVSVLNPKVLESQTEEKDASSALQHFFSVHTSWVTGVAPHPASANHFLTTSRDKTVRLWNLAEKSLVREWAHASATWCVAYAPTGKFFAVGCGDNSVAVYHQAEAKAAPAAAAEGGGGNS